MMVLTQGVIPYTPLQNSYKSLPKEQQLSLVEIRVCGQGARECSASSSQSASLCFIRVRLSLPSLNFSSKGDGVNSSRQRSIFPPCSLSSQALADSSGCCMYVSHSQTSDSSFLSLPHTSKFLAVEAQR